MEECAPQLDPEARRYLDIVRQNTRQMGELVDDLLSFSRLSRQAPKKQRIRPGNLVHECLDELQPEREGREVEVTVGDLAACEADPALLKQVFLNLLSNALKFTRKREVAHIEIGCTSGSSLPPAAREGAEGVSPPPNPEGEGGQETMLPSTSFATTA